MYTGFYVTKVDCGSVVKYRIATREHTAPQYYRLPKETVLKDEKGNIIELEPNAMLFIDKDGYIRHTIKSETKKENIDSIKRSFARLRDLINANVDDPEKVLFVTFTYDPKKLNKELNLKKVSHDMRNTFDRMRKDNLKFQYIYTVEQQKNGNWHTHVIMFFEERAPYIEQCILERYWKHGFARISKRFDDDSIGNIGAYLVADMTYGDRSGEHGRVKYERLLSYPSGMHLYRCSRGLKRPVKRSMSYQIYEIEVKGKKPLYEKRKAVKYGMKTEWYIYQHYKS